MATTRKAASNKGGRCAKLCKADMMKVKGGGLSIVNNKSRKSRRK